jgi:anti-sigma28 factor (negative regulator of flagellin synthesis)
LKIDSTSSSPRPDPPSRQISPAESAPQQAPRLPANADAIEISAEARRVLAFPPDARERADLVARLRQQVDAGTYRPDVDAVARRLAERLDG